MARTDLLAARQTLLEAHPGASDAADREFSLWLDLGYREAHALLPAVFSYDTAMAAVRYYVSGFRDGHLLYSDHARGEARMYASGWAAAYRDGVPVVMSRAKDWPAPLPPLGARLLDCDGLRPERFIKERIAPFVDRREQRAVWESLLPHMQLQGLRGWEPRRCRFAAGADGADGEILELDVVYHPVSVERFFTTMRIEKSGSARSAGNGYELADGRLWIRARNFDLSPEQAMALDTMLQALAALREVDTIVFDMRGNSGGDSAVGQRIFDAATGGMQFKAWTSAGLQPLFAQWRVSALSLATVEQQHLGRALRLYGENSERARAASGFLAELRAAHAAGQVWVDQPAGFRLDRVEAERRGARLARFSGRLVLLTDAACVSACLDFADTVLRVPGALHVGETTGADTLYIDIGRQTLPSGNRLIVPLKVWRNRLRGPNEPLQPDVVLDLGRLDEAGLRAAVLRAADAISR